MEHKLTHLQKVYNENETIINAGFIMQSQYFLPVLSRMKNEGLINDAGAAVVQAIFSFKHTEENPYPTRETISRYLGMSVDYVKKALKSIKKAGILGIEKVGRKSTYDFKPFFALLEKFIVEFKHNKNYEVTVSELLNVKVVKESEAANFAWSEDYKEAEEKVVVPVPSETVQDASGEAEEVCEVTLPESISNVVQAYTVDIKGIEAITKAYIAFSGVLVDEIFVEKIIASLDADNFAKFFTKCITNAYTNKEQPTQSPVKPSSNGKFTVRKGKKVGVVPDWFDKNKEKEEQAARTQAEIEASKSLEQKINEAKDTTILDETIKGVTLTKEQAALVETKRAAIVAEFEAKRIAFLKELNDAEGI